MKKNEIKKEFENEVLDISRVERMTAGGRRLRFRTIVVVGNKKGKVGVGSAKGVDVQQSIEKSSKKGQKTAVVVPIAKGGTIPHEVKAKFGAAVVLLRPQSEGRGLVAGGTVRTICDMVGIENISGKLLGNTRNKLNNAKATIKALQQLKVPKEEGKTEEEIPSPDLKQDKQKKEEKPKEKKKGTTKKEAVKEEKPKEKETKKMEKKTVKKKKEEKPSNTLKESKK